MKVVFKNLPLFLKPLALPLCVLVALSSLVIAGALSDSKNQGLVTYTPQEVRVLLSSGLSLKDKESLRRTLLSQNDSWATLVVQALDKGDVKDAIRVLDNLRSADVPAPSSILVTPGIPPVFSP